MKVKGDHRSKFSNLSNWKYQGFNGIQNPLKPWYFQASSFQLLKLENLLRWSLFTLKELSKAKQSAMNKKVRVELKG